MTARPAAASTRERVTERPPSAVVNVDPRDADRSARAFFGVMPLDEDDLSLPAAEFLARLG